LPERRICIKLKPGAAWIDLIALKLSPEGS